MISSLPVTVEPIPPPKIRYAERWFTSLKYITSFLLWAYIFYRAVFLSITQDEAHSYLLAKTDNWRQMAGTTNTHWLNTLFIRVMLWLPGPDAMWKLRLLSILSWSVYAWSVIKISNDFKKKWVGFIFFFAAALNPFMLFYFSLERGYAPAFALLLFSLYLARKRIASNEYRPAKWIPVFLTAAMASLANFSAFYFFMALTIMFISYLIVNRNLTLLFAPASRPLLLIITPISVFTAIALLFIRSRNELYYGGTNITASMLGSMLHGSYYLDGHYSRYYSEGVSYLLAMNIPLFYQFLALILFSVLIIAFLWQGKKFFKSGKLTFTFFAISLSLFMLLINGFLHLLFNTPYLFSRTALILYPILITALFGIIDVSSRRNLPVNLLLGGFLIFLLFNYSKSFSLKKFIEWPVQTQTENTLNYLQTNHAKNVGMNLWDYSLLANYYSKAYPGRYNFNYAIIATNDRNGQVDKKNLAQYDHIVLVPPYDSILLRTWEPKAVLPFSKTLILKAPQMKPTN